MIRLEYNKLVKQMRLGVKKELRENEEQFRSIVKNSIDGIGLVDEQGVIVEWNHGMEKTMGLKRYQVLEQYIWDIHDKLFTVLNLEKEFYKSIRAEMLQLLKTGYRNNSGGILRECSITYPNQTQKLIQRMAFPIKTTKGYKVGIITRDVSALKAAELKLKKRERLLAASAEVTRKIHNGPDFKVAVEEALEVLGKAVQVDRVRIFEIITPPRDTKIIKLRFQWNSDYAMKINFNIDPSNLTYKDFMLQMWEELLLKGRTASEHISALPSKVQNYLEKQGTRAILLVPIHMNDTLWGFISFHDCHSERHWTNSEKSTLETVASSISSSLAIKRQNIELSKANKIKSEFLTNTSHDLRTPLASIMAYTEILRDISLGVLNDVHQECVREIVNSVEVLVGEVETLLELSRIENGNIALNREWISVDKQLNEVVNSMYPLFERKDVTLKLSIGFVPHLSLDRRAFRRIINNLLTNALKFTPAESIVTVKAKWVNHEIIFSVTDAGPGIDPRERESVFKKFYRAPQKSATSTGGTGLGLALCKQLVEMHKGRIWVDDAPGGGSVFCFTIPYIDKK